MVGVLHTVSGMWQLEDRVLLEVAKDFFRELKDGEGWLMGRERRRLCMLVYRGGVRRLRNQCYEVHLYILVISRKSIAILPNALCINRRG